MERALGALYGVVASRGQVCNFFKFLIMLNGRAGLEHVPLGPVIFRGHRERVNRTGWDMVDNAKEARDICSKQSSACAVH